MCALGVRYTSVDEHTTNTQRVLRVCLALVQRALRVRARVCVCVTHFHMRYTDINVIFRQAR
jgi:hypothetical protein